MEPEELQAHARRVRASARLLAEGPDEQVRYLRMIGTYPSADELALEFDESLFCLDRLVDCGEVGERAAGELRRLDEKLSSMSGEANAELWTEEALRQSGEWQEVRFLASSISGFGDADCYYFAIRGADPGGSAAGSHRVQSAKPMVWTIWSVDQLHSALAGIEERAERAQVVLIQGPYERELGLVVASPESMLGWQESLDPPYFASKGPVDAEDPSLVAWLDEHFTEFPRRVVIDRATATAAAESFVTNGRRPENVDWVVV